jgi:hypothetical protein
VDVKATRIGRLAALNLWPGVPQWSADGRSLAIVSKRGIYILGGAVLLLCGLAKVVALLFAMTDRSPPQFPFAVKQVLHAACLIGAGVEMVLKGRGSGAEPGPANPAQDSPQSFDPDWNGRLSGE